MLAVTSGSAAITVNAPPVITSVIATPSAICLGGSSNLVVSAPTGGATTIVNYDFNSGTRFRNAGTNTGLRHNQYSFGHCGLGNYSRQYRNGSECLYS